MKPDISRYCLTIEEMGILPPDTQIFTGVPLPGPNAGVRQILGRESEVWLP